MERADASKIVDVLLAADASDLSLLREGCTVLRDLFSEDPSERDRYWYFSSRDDADVQTIEMLQFFAELEEHPEKRLMSRSSMA